MVLRCCLPANAPYWLGHVVVHGCDNLVESYIVHSLLIEQVERYYVGSLAMFLIFLSNVPYTYMKSRCAINDCVCARVDERLSRLETT
jgi:hypothetical protein